MRLSAKNARALKCTVVAGKGIEEKVRPNLAGIELTRSNTAVVSEKTMILSFGKAHCEIRRKVRLV